MGFLEKIFGKKTALREREKPQLSVEELKLESEKRLEALKREFEKESKARFRGIKKSVSSAEESMKSIEGLDFKQDGENQYFRKIVQSSKESFSGKMAMLLEKTAPPEGKGFGQGFAYCQNAAREFQEGIMAFRKNITYTGLLAKKEMQELGKTIEELEKQLLELFELSKNSKITQSQRIIEIAEEMQGKEKAILEREKEAKELEAEIQGLDSEKSKVLKEAEGLKGSQAFKEVGEREKRMEELLSEKKELRETAANLLMPLEKQLRKMQALSGSKEWVLEKEQERMLNAYLESSFNALKQDPKGETLKQILQELKKAIWNGKISFKDEKEKARKCQAIEELEKFDFFTAFFWRLNELDKELPKVQESMEKSTLFKQLNALKAREELLERNAVQKTSELNSLKTVKETQKMRLREELLKLQEKAREAFGESVEITIKQ